MDELLHHTWEYSLGHQQQGSERVAVYGTELLAATTGSKPSGETLGQLTAPTEGEELCSGMPLLAAW